MIVIETEGTNKNYKSNERISYIFYAKVLKKLDDKGLINLIQLSKFTKVIVTNLKKIEKKNFNIFPCNFYNNKATRM